MNGPPSGAASPSPFRSDGLHGKVALVTGGGSGIGFAIAQELLRAGCSGLILCGRRAHFLEQAAHALHTECSRTPAAVVQYQVCDVRDYAQCQAAVDFCRHKFGRLDILVNGAAGNFLAQASQLSPKGFATVMAIDAAGTFHMCRAAYALLSETVSAHPSSIASTCIINISATLQYGATWWQAHASAAKAAVDSLTRSLALEWGSQENKIRVNGIAPGPIANTPGTTKLAPEGMDDPSLIQDMLQDRIPLQRMGEAWEIGHAAVYLALSEYVTGHTLVVDGGEWIGRGEPFVPKEMVAELSRRVEAVSRAQGPTTTPTTSHTTTRLDSDWQNESVASKQATRYKRSKL